MKNRVYFVLLPLTLTSACAKVEQAPNPPNVVLITIDDLGWTDLACYGSRYYETPNLDRLASQGMKFTDAYAAAAVCSPTRAALMTGRYPARIGITDWIHARFQLHEFNETLPEDGIFPGGYVTRPDRRLQCPLNPWWMEHDEITIAEVLKPAGYTSCHIGKWHLGTDDWYPESQGFDINIGGCDFGQPPTYFDPYYSDKYGEGDIPTLTPRRKGEYLTDREAFEAVEFIREHRDGPFFLHLAHYAVHTPIEGKPELVRKYEAKTPEGKQTSPTYAAMVESVDDSVGRVVETLEELGLIENTMILFTSDNGGLQRPTSTDNAPLRSGKGYPYEGGIRIPQIVRWDGVVEPGSVSKTPVISVDVLPTVCEALGVEIPFDRPIDGVSLMPLLTQGGEIVRDSIFWHFPHYRGEIMPYSIVRTGDWKLIKRYEGTRFELYNLEEDLGEERDLADRFPDRVEELDGRLEAWLKDTGAKVPRVNPDYRPE
jgi:arylsulfatase A-like enzyme